MSYATIDELRANLSGKGPSAYTAAYAAKMLHAIPKGESVDRTAFLMERCKGLVVLHVGASGPLHEALKQHAAKVYGWDREDGEDVIGLDLDERDVALPFHPDVDVILCGEVLEHLSNPGQLLYKLRLRYRDVPLIVTVPNAFSEVGRSHIKRGVENVNKDHVSYYSYRTLRTLLERAGYTPSELFWYNGPPYLAEGLIVVTE